jgi:hypothetical protein
MAVSGGCFIDLLLSTPFYAMQTLQTLMQSFCWKIRWLCRRRGVKPEVIAVIEMGDFRRLLEQGRVPSEIPVSCWVCDNLLCRDSKQFLEHEGGPTHRKKRRALMLDH